MQTEGITPLMGTYEARTTAKVAQQSPCIVGAGLVPALLGHYISTWENTMSMEIEMLRKIPYFSTLSPDELAQIATVTVERHYNRGDLILIEGETEGALYY